MIRNNLLFIAILLVTVLGVVQSQQYIPVQVLIPVNQTYGGVNTVYKPVSNYTYYNHSNTYSTSNTGSNGYRPPGSYLGNQYPNYPAYYNNNSRSNNSTYNGTQDGHLFVGQIQLYDRLLFNQNYRKEKRWYGTRDKIIEYPQGSPAGYTRHEIISAIRIYNQFLDGNSARATIIKGGVGYQYVKIQLESSWNKGFQYLVQIYGH